MGTLIDRQVSYQISELNSGQNEMIGQAYYPPATAIDTRLLFCLVSAFDLFNQRLEHVSSVGMSSCSWPSSSS